MDSMDKACVIFHEINSGYVSVWPSQTGNLEEFGQWMYDCMCEATVAVKPDFPSIDLIIGFLSQQDIDQLEVEELLQSC